MFYFKVYLILVIFILCLSSYVLVKGMDLEYIKEKGGVKERLRKGES